MRRNKRRRKRKTKRTESIGREGGIRRIGEELKVVKI